MRNWLIRTKNNFLLGPVSKDKLKELLDKNMLKSDDEIKSGNGYWFYVKEHDLVEKYVYQDNIQDYYCLDLEDKKENKNKESDNKDNNLPSDDLLEYPDVD
jgi:hypothetical protein